MPALGAGARVIGDLVGRNAGGLGQLLGDLVESIGEVGVRHGELAGAVQASERRPFFDGELIEREMIAHQRQRLGEFRAPGVGRLGGARVDQIERETLEGGGGDVDGAARLGRRMQPPQRAQVTIVHRLHAERHAVDAGRAIAGEALRLDARRVGLERDLGVGRDGPCGGDAIQNAADGRGFHE